MILRPTTVVRTVAGFLSATLFLIGLLVVGVNARVHADDQQFKQTGSLITIHDRGDERVVISHAATIGDALKDAGYELDARDAVEPSADQKIIAKEYSVNIYRARPVVVVDGGIREKVMTAYQTAEQIAAQVGITLYPEDVTTIGRSEDILSDGASLTLTITRAKPFSFVLYGEKTEVRTQGKTVGDMLKEKEIVLGKDDHVSPGLSTALTSGMTVTVWREGRQTVTVTEPVPYTTQSIQDANQPVGYSNVQTPGQDGSQNVTYEVEIRDGKEVARTKIASIVTTPAVEEVKVVGTYLPLTSGYSADRVSIMTQAGVSASDQGYAAYIIDHENATWCPTRWQGQNGCPAVYVALYAEGADIGYGICQATPGNKMATAGADWKTNPITQMKWCANYAQGRYGSWANAYNFKVAHGWW